PRARGARVRAVPATHRRRARGRGAHAGCLRAGVGAARELSRRECVRFVAVPPDGQRRIHEPPHDAAPGAAGVRDRGPGRAGAARLPKSIAPPRDLWPGIETRIAGKRPGKGERGRGWLPWVLVPLAAAAILAAVLLGRRGTDERRGAWEVTRLAGLPVVGSSPLAASGAIRVGEWLETDDSSRAVILVGDIGHVEVKPDTRIRL